MKRRKIDGKYDRDYYESNGQLNDRPALRFYAGLATKYLRAGTVLDFGCGTGALLRHLAGKFNPIGLEHSAWARREVKALGFRAIAETAELEADTCSGVMSIHVIEHIPDAELETIFDEWDRILVDGGRLILVTPDAGGYAAETKGSEWSALSDPTHINLKPHSTWKRMFEAHGYKILHECADGLWDFPYKYACLGKAEALLLAWPTLLQFLWRRSMLRPGTGEACIFILERAHRQDR